MRLLPLLYCYKGVAVDLLDVLHRQASVLLQEVDVSEFVNEAAERHSYRSCKCASKGHSWQAWHSTNAAVRELVAAVVHRSVAQRLLLLREP